MGLELIYQGDRTYLLLCGGLHSKIVDMQAALCLLPFTCPTARSLSSIPITALGSTMPVANATVPLVEQLVPWYIVLLHVPFHEWECPRKQWV